MHHIRDVEAAVGVGHGNLDRLLNGTLELRVRHLLAFARLLNIPPAELLELGCWRATRTAQRRLVDWLEPERLPATPEELSELIRTVVREELDAREQSATAEKAPRR